jgi:hypothetical protein
MRSGSSTRSDGTPMCSAPIVVVRLALVGLERLVPQLLEEARDLLTTPLTVRLQCLQKPAQMSPQRKSQHGMRVPLQSGNEIIQLICTFLERPRG